MSLYGRIAFALLDAGFASGQQHRGGGWSDAGDNEYVPAIAGFVINSRIVGHAPDGGYLRRHYVDHAGKGRKAMLPRYADTLTAAGFEIETAPLHETMTKRVVWVGKAEP